MEEQEELNGQTAGDREERGWSVFHARGREKERNAVTCQGTHQARTPPEEGPNPLWGMHEHRVRARTHTRGRADCKMDQTRRHALGNDNTQEAARDWTSDRQPFWRWRSLSTLLLSRLQNKNPFDQRDVCHIVPETLNLC